MSIEIINNRIASFTPEYRDFVMSDYSDAIAAKIAKEEGFDDDTETAMANMIFLYTILIVSDYELTEALVADCGLGMTEALRITKSILSTMPPEMVAAQRDAYAEIMKSDSPIDEKTRRDIIATQPERQKLVYLYAKTNPHLRVLLEQFALLEEQVEAGMVLLGDIVLGFYKTEDTVPLLQQELGLDPKTAALLGAEVLEFLTSITNPNWQPPADAPRTAETPIAQIPLKAPAAFVTPALEPIPSAAIVEPTPVYQPAPVGYASTPAPVPPPGPAPTYQSTESVPAAAPLSSIPSYTPPPTPPAPVTPPPAPDRPRWSTEI